MKIVIILILVIGLNPAAAEDKWQLVKDKDNIQLYAVQQPDRKLKTFKAVTQINKNTHIVLAALQDASACSQWVYNCIENKMITMIDVKQRVYHTIIKSPLWFKNRDFYLRSDVSYDPVIQSFQITLTADPNHAAVHKNHVRLSTVNMVWQLKSVAENKTAVSYEVYIDPKLPIKSINHQMIRRSIFKTTLGLKILVENPIYANTTYTQSELDMLLE